MPRWTTGETFHLDLTSCRSLENLSIRCNISLSLYTANLQTYTLWTIHLSDGNLLEELKNSPKLTKLSLWDCYFPDLHIRHILKVWLDLSACTYVSNIYVGNSDVRVINNGNIIGKENSEWRKTVRD